MELQGCRGRKSRLAWSRLHAVQEGEGDRGRRQEGRRAEWGRGQDPGDTVLCVKLRWVASGRGRFVQNRRRDAHVQESQGTAPGGSGCPQPGASAGVGPARRLLGWQPQATTALAKGPPSGEEPTAGGGWGRAALPSWFPVLLAACSDLAALPSTRAEAAIRERGGQQVWPAVQPCLCERTPGGCGRAKA